MRLIYFTLKKRFFFQAQKLASEGIMELGNV